MRTIDFKATLKVAVRTVSLLLLGAVATFGQQVVNLTAGPAAAYLPDGSTVPMWGYSCGTAAAGSTATCAKLNASAPAGTTTALAGWSPVVITVPTGQGLTINLTNFLTFTPTGSTTANTVPTSLVIVGQVGGGLGSLLQRTTVASPVHATEQTTWPIAHSGNPLVTYTPQAQGARVQSFATEVAAAGSTAVAPQVASGSGLTWASLQPGTYLIESGTHPSIQGAMGLYGILVVTCAPTATAGCPVTAGTTTTTVAAGTAYPATATTAAVTYSADVPLLLSEIDPVQNNAVNTAVNTAGFSETKVWSGQPGQCGNPSAAAGTVNTCYPPAVNYTPLYYMINGVPFNKTNASLSLFPTTPATGLTPGTGTVLVRLVNAGLRMHVPSIVGSQTTGVTGAGAAAPVAGFTLIAEDGNLVPSAAPIVSTTVVAVPRVQSDVFMAAGKTYDVKVNVPAAGAPSLAVFDRELSLSSNGTGRDGGMLAYLGINGSVIPADPALASAVANPDTYNAVNPCPTAPCTALNVSDPGKGVIANDINVYGVKLIGTGVTSSGVSTTLVSGKGTLTLNSNGTFIYLPNAGFSGTDAFTYQANGTTGPTTTVTLGSAIVEAASGITMNASAYTAPGTFLSIKPPGILEYDKDAAGYPLTVALTAGNAPVASGGLTLSVDPNGGFNASIASCTTPSGCVSTFTYHAQNSQRTVSSSSATVTITFRPPSNLAVTVLDGKDKTTQISDYRWIIEEDRTFFNDPAKTTNTSGNGALPTCIAGTAGCALVPVFGVNFHTSSMPFVAQGCTGTVSCETGQMMVTAAGTHVAAVCDVGNGACRTGASAKTAISPGQVSLDPTKRYYLSILPGDAGNAFNTGNVTASCAPVTYGNPPNPSYTTSNCGHGMGGAPIPVACTPAPGATTCTGTVTFAPVTVLVEPNPFPTAKISVMVFEDDFPLNGEQDAGGGVDIISPNEPGLGGFNIIVMDQNQSTGDATGQDTYDMFNQPLSNALAGMMDPTTHQDACPISTNARAAADPTQTGITGMIVTCPTYEADGTTQSPLAGQALIANIMPSRYSIVATPGADRIASGEEWLQTNTLDGQKGHDAFVRIGEPGYFQEYGPAGYHVSIGFANPKIINARLASVCAGGITGTADPCTSGLTGRITGARQSRTPDERLYGSGSRDTFYFTQCYVSFGDPDGEDFAFTKCAGDGTFSLSGLPSGAWRLTIFDQWNDQIVDGLATPANLVVGQTLPMGDIPVQQWKSNVYTRTFIDDFKTGVALSNSTGVPLIATEVRFKDGSMANALLTDFSGTANFNETFPLFNWYTVETDPTRYKTTGIHVVYDAGGPADGSPSCGQSGYPACGTSTIGHLLARTHEDNPLPANLSVPGAVYCPAADCTGLSIANGPRRPAASERSTGRIDPPWVTMEGWQGFVGQNNFIEFGKTPYTPGENGGIRGHVVYAQTRPFDDPWMLVQVPWDPLVANVTMNLYQEGFAADGITPTLNLVDTTQTSSWDKWAQGFRSDGVPNMNCPGQSASDLFYFSLYNQPNYLNLYDSQHGGPAPTALPNHSQFKCFDGLHNFNQVQPAPYDGAYAFPSIIGLNPTTGKPAGNGSTYGTPANMFGTNCTICIPNPDATDTYRRGLPMLPAGKYVVEVVLPAGYELVKEEDKNILIGDNFIAPVTQQIPGLSAYVFIMPDQAAIASEYNANNAQNMTQHLGAQPQNGIVPGFVPEPVWPCVGQLRIVPDYMSIFPQSLEVAPFQGASRNLCDRKEVTLPDQSAVTAKFYVYTSAHIAAHFTGIITDDFTSEFDPFSPAFGEKFAPPNMPVSVKDWAGNETNRVYSDWWGAYDGLTYSTWEYNPPNITGVNPAMMVMCMNDSGPVLDTRAGSPTVNQMITDPLFHPQYSNFCYELPFLAGQTQYADTPVVPTSSFAAGYNHPDCDYPALTPSISEVDGDGIGPWVSAPNKTLTITSLTAAVDQSVINYGYSGPSANVAPFNQKTIPRHYGFGSAAGTVTIGGVAAAVGTWNDTTITITVPSGVPACAIQQQAQYGGSAASCGELVITAASGQKSIDTVTVTIGGKTPKHVGASGSIQNAIDIAQPGDLIIIDPTCATPAAAATPVACTTAGATTHTNSSHNEMVLMWKPVRLQGVGAASSIINANAHPAGKLDPWRRQVLCLFGITINGRGIDAGNPFDTTGTYTCDSTMQFQVDRAPLEAVVGWDASQNGNLAEMLQEPTIMGAYEGAGITVLSKGVNFHGAADPFGVAAATPGAFPTGTTLLSSSDCADSTGSNPFPSNFYCNPSSIDGLTVNNSSTGGGGIFVHAWGHNLQIANNRVHNNHGTLSGGISVGQGEFPPGNTQGGIIITPPGSCVIGSYTGQLLPYCLEVNVNVHHNAVTLNSSIGDELFSATNAGAGGVSFCTGADNYQFNYNWVCGNMSAGDGGGVGHLGYIWNGQMQYNSILFNQSMNPTIPTNGGGIIVMGTPDPDPVCGTMPDQDCPPGLSDGVGPGLQINGNLIMGNSAESGSGGGLRLQGLNGTEVIAFPTTPDNWYGVSVTNNIIANNVAGWDGGGVSMHDALKVDFINNTVVSNDSTASSGVLFTTLGAPLASAPGTNCSVGGGTSSCAQVAGLVSTQNSPPLVAGIGTQTITCPNGNFSTAAGGTATNGTCTKISYPRLANNVIWQNRSFKVGVGALSSQYQQHIVSLFNASGSAVASQTSTGACVAGSSYWDIGVRGDGGPTTHNSGFTLNPRYSFLTSTAGYDATNRATNPGVVSQYCNGSRIPPECTTADGCLGAGGFNVPPGISDAVVPNPVFSLTPAATVDEGNNWINMTWGPLTLTNPSISAGTPASYGGGPKLGNYALAAGSPAIDFVPTSSPDGYATTDFFGHPRPDPGNPNVDAGAVEFGAAAGTGSSTASVTGGPLAFGNVAIHTTSAPQTLTLINSGTANLTGITLAFSSPRYSRPAGAAGGTCTTTLTPAAGSCTIKVVFSPTVVGQVPATLTITANVAVTGSPVTLSGNGH
jgi:Big-like domain-containing protein